MEEYYFKMIDENSQRATCYKAISVRAGNRFLWRKQSDSPRFPINLINNQLPIRHQFPANPLESAHSTFCIGTEQNVPIYTRVWKSTREQTGEITKSRWAHWKFLDKTSLFPDYAHL